MSLWHSCVQDLNWRPKRMGPNGICHTAADCLGKYYNNLTKRLYDISAVGRPCTYSGSLGSVGPLSYTCSYCILSASIECLAALTGQKVGALGREPQTKVIHKGRLFHKAWASLLTPPNILSVARLHHIKNHIFNHIMVRVQLMAKCLLRCLPHGLEPWCRLYNFNRERPELI